MLDQSADQVTPFSVKDILNMSAAETDFSGSDLYHSQSGIKSEIGGNVMYDDYQNSWDWGYDHYGCNFYNHGDGLGKGDATTTTTTTTGYVGGKAEFSHVQQLTSFCAPYEPRELDSPSKLHYTIHI